MARDLGSRLAKLEAARFGGGVRFALLPYGAHDHGPEHLAAARAETVERHQAQTGHRPRVLITTGVPREADRGA